MRDVPGFCSADHMLAIMLTSLICKPQNCLHSATLYFWKPGKARLCSDGGHEPGKTVTGLCSIMEFICTGIPGWVYNQVTFSAVCITLLITATNISMLLFGGGE